MSREEPRGAEMSRGCKFASATSMSHDTCGGSSLVKATSRVESKMSHQARQRACSRCSGSGLAERDSAGRRRGVGYLYSPFPPTPALKG